LGLVFILLANTVHGLGISPSKEIVYFEPNKIENIDFYVVNRDPTLIGVDLSLDGAFTDKMTINRDSTFSLGPNQKEYFDLTFNMPSEVNVPGDHIAKLMAHETTPEGAQDYTVGSTVAVISKVIFRVPFEGYYLSASILAESVSVGDDVEFEITLENLGDKMISNFDGSVLIYNSKDELVDTLEFSNSLGLHEIKDMALSWNTADQVADEYYANLVINYMGKTFETEVDFKLGDIFVDILEYQKEVDSGKIGDYSYIIESGWNNDIQNVFVKLVIEYDGQGYIYKSENFNLIPWEVKEDKMYIDAREIPEGVYPATFGVYYEGLSNTESFDIKVAKKVNYLLIGGVSLLVLIIIALLIFIFMIMRSRRKRSSKR